MKLKYYLYDIGVYGSISVFYKTFLFIFTQFRNVINCVKRLISFAVIAEFCYKWVILLHDTSKKQP